MYQKYARSSIESVNARPDSRTGVVIEPGTTTKLRVFLVPGPDGSDRDY
jgi:hypothetical protein